MRDDLKVILGYYEKDSDQTPKVEPGMTGPCIVCMKKLSPSGNPLTSDLTRVSFQDPRPGSTKQLFFRVHRKCWMALSNVEQAEYKISLGMKP